MQYYLDMDSPQEQIAAEFRQALNGFVGRKLETIDVNRFAEEQAARLRRYFGDRLVSVTAKAGEDNTIHLEIAFIPEWIEVSFTVEPLDGTPNRSDAA